jgi:hypothetical protein
MTTLDENGLVIDSLNEIVDRKNQQYKDIYGDDIVIDSNSPDGQRINIEAQVERDILELGLNIFNSFDILQASGVVLDQRLSLLNLRRQEGTFTQQEVDITTDRSLTLSGLDNTSTTPYTLIDDNGNEFQLITTANLTAGTTTLLFQASQLGEIVTLPNTITTQVTIVLGVTNINNPNAPLEIGVDEETDTQARLRMLRSPALTSQGFIEGLTSILFNLDNVSDVLVLENETDVIDADLIPPHSGWIIIEGGDNNEIARAALSKKTTGAGWKVGSVSVDVVLDTGQTKTVYFDRPVSKNLYIRFEIQPTIVGQSFDEDGIKQYILDNKTYGIAESAETASLTQISLDAITNTGGGGVPVNLEISDDGVSYVDFLAVSSKEEKWIISTINIDITIL